jgi:TonB-linked SusC/RagA family outer membrane protein
MKKNFNNVRLIPSGKGLKILRFMKLLLFFVLLSVLGFSANVFPQNANLNLNVRNKTVKDVFKDIENQSQVRFFYNDDFTGLNREVTLDAYDKSFEQVMDILLAGANLTYKEFENNVIVITPLDQAIKQNEVRGRVTDAMTREPLPGVNVYIQGTTQGVVTGYDGEYLIEVPGPQAILVYSFMGYEQQTVVVGNQQVVNIQLEQDYRFLEEVVVTGVIASTPTTKLGFTVEKISGEDIQRAPSVNVASSLASRSAGIKVGGSGYAPGSNPDIQLRTLTTIFGSSNPLIIIDGVLTEGNLSDINSEDISSIEIVKGAAASSLYGSRAANGVINITTKRGTGIRAGTSEITARTEMGQSFIPYVPQKTSAINFQPTGGAIDYTNPRPDGVYLTPYPSVTDPVGMFFDPGFYQTQYLSFRGNSENGRTALFSSLQYTDEKGVVKLTDGLSRANFRLNLDHRVNDRIKIVASNLYSQSTIDQRAVGGWDMFYYADPDADFLAPNEDGTPYNVNVNKLNPRQSNPLYIINNTINESNRNRFMGHYAIDFDVLDNLQLSAAYGIDRLGSESFALTPKGLFQADQDILTNGNISRANSNTLAQTLQGDAFFHQTFGNFNTKVRLQYLYESSDYNWFSGSGSHLAVKGRDVTNLNQASQNLNINSFTSKVIAQNVSGVIFLDYKDKYIFDALIRQDGVSLFGGRERWQTFYRVSGAWRLTQDFDIPGFRELKLRASYGVAGLRPPFAAQYEVVGLSNGVITSPVTIGNQDLKSSFSNELEVGVDADFLDRFNFTFNYANSINTHQILEVPVSATTGFATQWQNAGKLEAHAWEATLGANIVRRPGVQWDIRLMYDRITQTVIELNRPGYAIVSGGIFRIEEGVPFGTFYGRKWARSLEDVANQVPAGYSLNEYFTVNNEGFVVRTETIGTIEEEPIQVMDDNRVFVEEAIGSVIPDFNLNLSSNLTWRNFNLFMLFGYQHGGDNYNHMRRYMMVNKVHSILDQSGKPGNEIKSIRYYNRLTTWNNEYFIEDATFLKLRELALSYNLGAEALNNFLGVKNVRLSLIGRNLLTLTNYSGFDPETGHSESGVDSNILRFDISSYPNFATFSFSVQVTF